MRSAAGLERYDTKTVKLIASRLPAKDYRFSALVLEIVKSLPFQSRRPAAIDPATRKGTHAMIVTRKHLHRRSFLKGMGAVVALRCSTR